ncbi:MAG: rod shape-determining protein MreD [Prevotella sp.]|jgi:rod shape-determining protein MreD
MNIDFLKRLALFLILLLVQALVLNHIHLFNYATPLLYVYFVLSFRRGYPKWAILLWSFLLGISIDVFSNTPGLAASSMTLIALLQPYTLELFLQREAEDNFQPAICTMGLAKYSLFALIITFVYCLVFFTLETFTFFNALEWLLSVLGSTLLSFILILVIDNLRKE